MTIFLAIRQKSEGTEHNLKRERAVELETCPIGYYIVIFTIRRDWGV